MAYSVSSATVACIWLTLLSCLAMTVLLFIYIRKKFNSSGRMFFTGAMIFAVFAMILETAPKQMILAGLISSGAGNWLIALAGALLAGIFEESGRFFAFSVIFRKSRKNDGNALMFGAGHAGCEIVLLVVFSMVNNLIMASGLNAGNAGVLLAQIDESQRAALEESFHQLSTASPGLFLVSVVERIAAVAAHISLSVVVWAACKKPGKKWLFLIAILLHTWLDFVPGLCSLNGVPTAIIEFLVYLCAALCVVVAVRVWKTVLKGTATPAAEAPADL